MRKRNRSQESVVYLAINSINGNRYIGVTCDYLSRRKAKHFWSAEKKDSQTYFHRAIRKYGRKTFNFSVLGVFKNFDDALQAEIGFIRELRPEYNMTGGGDGTVGLHLSAEQIKKGVDARRGQPGYWKGKTLPPHVVACISIRNQTPERVAAWTTHRLMGPAAMARKIICLDDGKIYDHAAAAAAAYGLNADVIGSVCRRSRHKTAGGFVFRFVTDPLAINENPQEVREAVLASRQRAAAIARGVRR